MGVRLKFWEKQRSGHPLSLSEWGGYYDHFQYLTHSYPLFGYGPTYPNEKLEEIRSNFRGYAGGGFMGNVVVFACILSRIQVFTQARFQFRELRGGRPGDYFGTEVLLPLEQPEPGKTTSDLLSRMETDVSLAGNSFHVLRGNRIKHLRPDWVAIVLGGEYEGDPDAEVAGYLYWPGGPEAYRPGGSRYGQDPIALLRDEVAHYAPVPDPLAQYRGMSWLTPAIREIMADSGFRDHKIKFLEHGGTHNFLFQVDPASMTEDQFNSWTAAYRAKYEGGNAPYSSIFMRAAIDATPLGANFQQTDFKKVQGAGETRIAAAAGVPPIVAGLSEGLESATYSNYQQAWRHFADSTCRWLWQNACGSLATIVAVPPGAQLWYDDRDIPALKEDIEQRAKVLMSQMQSIKSGIEAGLEPDSVIDAVSSEDLKRLKHTGLVSVQLQEPGSQNGNVNGAVSSLPSSAGPST